MTWEIFGIYAAAGCLFVGSAFALVGVIGLMKFNDPMTRLHAPTKVGTVGIGAMLFASMIYAFSTGQGSVHEALIMAFLFATAPISALFIAKVNVHRQDCATPPAPPRDAAWATQNMPEADRELFGKVSG